MTKILLFNKPYGVISQFSGDEHTTLKSYINLPGFYPAGRLDKDSEGLLLLTNDGKLQQKLSNPQYNKEKEYWVQVEGTPSQTALEKLRRGITLKDGPCLPAQVQIIEEPILWPRNPPVRYRRTIPTTWLNILLKEGRNRQIRRMTAAVGYPTLRLVRHKIDKWHLGSLQPGEYCIIR